MALTAVERQTREVLVVARGLPVVAASLEEAGFRVQVVEPGEVDGAGRPDVVLFAASLGLRLVGVLTRRLADAGARHRVVVFADGDLAALEACVRAGYDYVAPPYSPVLLRGRLLSTGERDRFAALADRRAAEAAFHEYEQDLSLVNDLQAGFLPDVLPAPPGWELAARFRPARLVAGDFYDCFELLDGHRLGLVVADVCDKGIGAALFMALIRTLLRHGAEDDAVPREAGDPGLSPRLTHGAGPLARAVADTNRYLARNHLRQGYFATVFFGVLDPLSGDLVYINCGHNPPVVVRADGSRTELPPTGPALGMLADGVHALGHVRLGPGDSLLVYTDGVTEARDAVGRRLGVEPVLAAVPPGGSAEELLASVDEVLRRHVGGASQSDDITVLGLHRVGPAPLLGRVPLH
ncbi:PP2C family protein-serine/threonine phosphatase [Saccharothrix sp. Mg75]|uniref:PP2C family protein-serine/threonine phosphatase n=1 Tax=Saccharothrix sp. Mg75 TaxID=3445357 RepID=UPI003EE86566